MRISEVPRPVARLLATAALLAVVAARAAAQVPDAVPVPAALPVPDAAPAVAAEPEASGPLELARGMASWYGPRFHGRRTSNGERFDMNGLTAAHPSLPFGTKVLVRNLANGREVIVRINDRLPHVRDRIIDLSKAAAAALGFIKAGETQVVLIER